MTTRAWVAVLKAPRSFAIACPCPAVSPSAHSPPLSTQIFLLVVQLNPCSTVFCRERGRAGKSGVEEGRAGKEGERRGQRRKEGDMNERTKNRRSVHIGHTSDNRFKHNQTPWRRGSSV